MIRRRTPSPRRAAARGMALACAAVLAVVPTACGGDDSADQPADVGEPAVDDESATADESAAGEEPPAGDGGGSDGGLGSGTGTVTFDGEEYRFATGDEAFAGQCRNLYGVLVVDLPLVEANGTAIPADTGRLELQVELEDVPDYEPWASLSVPGGRWFAGDEEVADISGVETPDMTLSASGNTVSGTQAMVPMVTGVANEIEATIEVTCE